MIPVFRPPVDGRPRDFGVSDIDDVMSYGYP